MSPTFEATFWGFVSGGALVIGATVGYFDSFHVNGIEIAFPQRDLHIKSAVPLRFLKDNLQSGSYDAFRAGSDKEKVRESGKSGTDELKMEL